MGEIRGGPGNSSDLDRARDVLVRRFDAARVRGDHRQGIPHDEDADQILAQLGRGERLLVMARGGVLVSESPIRVAEALVNEGNACKVADLARPLERLLVIGRRGLRLAQVLRAPAQSYEHSESQQLIRRLRVLDPP